MDEKTYIVVTNAHREIMTHSKPGLRSRTGVMGYSYRKGDLGLIHPEIVEFYSDLSNNMQNESGTGSKSYHAIPTSGMLIEVFKYNQEDVPILMWKGNLSGDRSYAPLQTNERDHFLVALKEGEYSKIEGNDLVAVKQGVNEIYSKYRINNSQPSRNSGELEKATEEQWKMLEKADNFIRENGIDHIPLEMAQRHIEDSSISNVQSLKERLDANRKFRHDSYRSLRDKPYRISASV